MDRIDKNGQMTFDFGFGENNAEIEENDIPEEELPEDVGSVESADAADDPEDYIQDFGGGIVEDDVETAADDDGGAGEPSDDGSPASATVCAAEETEDGRGRIETAAPPLPSLLKIKLNRRTVQRAALAFLSTLHPDALALCVPMKKRRFTADAACAWIKVGAKGVSSASKTAVIFCAMTKAETLQWTGDDGLWRLLEAAKLEKNELEAGIRQTEPELKDDAVLFGEYESWNYVRSKNPAYHECLSRIKSYEKSLSGGSLADRLKRMATASGIYLAAPSDLADSLEIAEKIGLLRIEPDLAFKLVKAPEPLETAPEAMKRLALNIACASMKSVLFANGIAGSEDNPRLTRLPRLRRF